jgi:chromosome segregation ATPase
MASSPDTFAELETKIVRTVDLVKTTRQELAAARTQVKTLEHEVEQLRRERDVVKNKVESLLEMLSELIEETVV